MDFNIMKRLTLILVLGSAFARFAYSGTEVSGKEMKQVAPPPCPEWYSDNEWNVNLWGTYAFTNTEYQPNLWLVDVVQSTSERHPLVGIFDKHIGGHQAWGREGEIRSH